MKFYIIMQANNYVVFDQFFTTCTGKWIMYYLAQGRILCENSKSIITMIP